MTLKSAKDYLNNYKTLPPDRIWPAIQNDLKSPIGGIQSASELIKIILDEIDADIIDENIESIKTLNQLIQSYIPKLMRVLDAASLYYESENRRNSS